MDEKYYIQFMVEMLLIQMKNLYIYITWMDENTNQHPNYGQNMFNVAENFEMKIKNKLIFFIKKAMWQVWFSVELAPPKH